MRRLLAAVCFLALPAFSGGVVSGVLRDAVTGAPLGGARLSLMRLGSLPPVTQSADGTGEFRFTDVPPGAYVLTVERRGYASIRNSPREPAVEVVDGAETKLETALTPGVEIAGRVVSEDGTPLANAHVAVRDIGAMTDREGRFRLADLPAGTQSVSVTLSEDQRRATLSGPPGNVRGYPPEFRAQFNLAAGQRNTGVELRMERERLFTFSGTVIDGRTGELLASAAEIELFRQTTPVVRLERRALGPGAAFQYDMLLPGAYTLTVFRPPRDLNRPIPISVTLGAENLTGHRVVLPAGGGRVLAVFKKPPPPGYDVSLMSAGSGSLRPKKAEDGTLVFEDVPPGRWQFITWRSHIGLSDAERRRPWKPNISQAGRPLRLDKMIEVTGGDQGPYEIEFTPQSIVTGTIVDRTGRPVPDAILVEILPRGKQVFFAGRRDGSFQVELDPGDYKLSAWPRDAAQQAGECAQTQTLRVTAEDLSGIRMVVCP